MVASVLAGYPTGAMVSMNEAMSASVHSLLYESSEFAPGQPSLIAMNISSS